MLVLSGIIQKIRGFGKIASEKKDFVCCCEQNFRFSDKRGAKSKEARQTWRSEDFGKTSFFVSSVRFRSSRERWAPITLFLNSPGERVFRNVPRAGGVVVAGLSRTVYLYIILGLLPVGA
ncbi:hypothetical protein Y981_02325 [Leptospirillum ferriphilum YSK]|uniref:Uncharacterized protein n=1 Tax=Leptospirillum ferriphilum YSK TaxID=1441628 RepID=A0A059XS99_9BACT|nr:hypothetical protein Y981_02325 [Leptospirillum ferriphilum YSK]